MPRKNSTAWVPNAPITAVRLEDFNEDLDDAYATGSDHLKVYRLAADPALQVTIGPWTYRVGAVEGQYAGWTLTVGASVTTYIMINSAGAIQTSTSAWNGQYTRLAVVVSGVSTITSITDWRNKVVGGEIGVAWFQNVTSTTYTKWLLTTVVADGVTWTLTYEKWQLKSYTNGVNTWTLTYSSGRRISTTAKT